MENLRLKPVTLSFHIVMLWLSNLEEAGAAWQEESVVEDQEIWISSQIWRDRTNSNKEFILYLLPGCWQMTQQELLIVL